jgi:hypothetical protein
MSNLVRFSAGLVVAVSVLSSHPVAPAQTGGATAPSVTEVSQSLS